jgi:hypothetical protein
MLLQSCRSSIGPWVPAMWSTLRRCFLLSVMDRGRMLPVLQRFVAGSQAVIDNLLLPLARDWDGFSATRHEVLSSDERESSGFGALTARALARAGQTAAMA